MKLKTVILENFRCYRTRTRINIGDFTAFIGKNDCGKSSILEALAIFFENDIIDIEAGDRHVKSDDPIVRIGCVFTDLPAEVVIDVDARTTLKDEYLLNGDGDLEVVKEYDSGKSKVGCVAYAVAEHPSARYCDDLLTLRNSELKARLKQAGVDPKGVNQTSNVSMRHAIWASLPDLPLVETRIPLEKEGAKPIWEQLQKHLPVYALFQADRPSRDEDDEVQDPMKLAVREAIQDVQAELDEVMSTVREKATKVAEETVRKLKEMNPDLARQLTPEFKADPKWDTLFKLTLRGDDGIPLNKRGSGVRRLVLLNFFRAAAERTCSERKVGVIYAIEEPESSQHPSHQRMLVEALKALSQRESCQVLITTHVPALAGLVDVQALRYVGRSADGGSEVRECDDTSLSEIADELGVLPDARRTDAVKVILCVEGKHDIAFLTRANEVLKEADASVPNVMADPRVLPLAVGGSNLMDWVLQQRLKALKRPEVHIYDRGRDQPPEHAKAVSAVNDRGGGCWAVLTSKHEAENYLHADAIREALGVSVTVDDQVDVPMAVAQAVHDQGEPPRPWEQMSDEEKRQKQSRIKHRLNGAALAAMTAARFSERDPTGEVRGWFVRIGAML